MFQFFPDPNIARQRQIFEIWIRPVVPVNAHMALRIAVHELDGLIQNGLTPRQFETTRDYLMNNVYVMTARQDQQLGYALDSRWYGIGEFTDYMREAAAGADRSSRSTPRSSGTSARATCRSSSSPRMRPALKQALVTDAFSPIKYDGEKPPDLLAEDKVIGAMKLNIAADKVRITPVA